MIFTNSPSTPALACQRSQSGWRPVPSCFANCTSSARCCSCDLPERMLLGGTSETGCSSTISPKGWSSKTSTPPVSDSSSHDDTTDARSDSPPSRFSFSSYCFSSYSANSLLTLEFARFIITEFFPARFRALVPYFMSLSSLHQAATLTVLNTNTSSTSLVICCSAVRSPRRRWRNFSFCCGEQDPMTD